jgi:hypothetical protein
MSKERERAWEDGGQEKSNTKAKYQIQSIRFGQGLSSPEMKYHKGT